MLPVIICTPVQCVVALPRIPAVVRKHSAGFLVHNAQPLGALRMLVVVSLPRAHRDTASTPFAETCERDLDCLSAAPLCLQYFGLLHSAVSRVGRVYRPSCVAHATACTIDSVEAAPMELEAIALTAARVMIVTVVVCDIVLPAFAQLRRFLRARLSIPAHMAFKMFALALSPRASCFLESTQARSPMTAA